MGQLFTSHLIVESFPSNNKPADLIITPESSFMCKRTNGTLNILKLIHIVVNLHLFLFDASCIWPQMHPLQAAKPYSSVIACAFELRRPAPNMNCTRNGDVAGSLAPGSLLAKVKLFLCSVCPWSRNSTIVGVYTELNR